MATTEASQITGVATAAVAAAPPHPKGPHGNPGSGPGATGRRDLPTVDRMVARVVTVVAYVVAVVPFVAGAILDATRGWLPYIDDAVIAWRASDVLSGHGPLVGQITLAQASGHATYDLGPLLYWLLAVPVHLDPVHGALWGAALWCAVAACLTVAAGRAVGGAAGALVAAAVFPVLTFALPDLGVDPTWNPSIGLCWYVAAAASAVAVGSGRRRWLPVLVATGSVAAQCHLSFAVAVPGLVAVALVLGLAATPGGERRSWRRPLLVAGGLAVAFWAPTVIQEFTGRPGNLTAILHSTGSQPVIGWTDGIRALGSAVGPHPLWWQNHTTMPFFTFVGTIVRGDIGAAVVVLALLVAVAAGALRSRMAALGAAAAVALVLDAGVVVSVARFPTKQFLALHYALSSAEAAGILSWIVIAWGGVVGCRAAARWARARRPVPPANPVADGHRRRRRAASIALVGAALAAAAPVPIALTAERADPSLALSGSVATQIRTVDATLRPVLGRQPVLVNIAPDPSLPPHSLSTLSLTLGVAWLAHTQGYDVRVPALDAAGVGPQAEPLPGIRQVAVTFPHGRPVATVVPRRAPASTRHAG